ncbi:hypothetical protein KCU87_g376, partial [Aureobasidium melanogenum]
LRIIFTQVASRLTSSKRSVSHLQGGQNKNGKAAQLEVFSTFLLLILQRLGIHDVLCPSENNQLIPLLNYNPFPSFSDSLLVM